MQTAKQMQKTAKCSAVNATVENQGNRDTDCQKMQEVPIFQLGIIGHKMLYYCSQGYMSTVPNKRTSMYASSIFKSVVGTYLTRSFSSSSLLKRSAQSGFSLCE